MPMGFFLPPEFDKFSFDDFCVINYVCSAFYNFLCVMSEQHGASKKLGMYIYALLCVSVCFCCNLGIEPLCELSLTSAHTTHHSGIVCATKARPALWYVAKASFLAAIFLRACVIWALGRLFL